ncbi:pentatricopeptide repeat-containing protein At1g26460, mitochondrial-like [Vitis riparia]|uniref:pentatricopeptide repeat-containing protein At1g26460, mitochondrial-like n=1 Tax=Vitis riparia TaxID=96939 RepID=UPI00155AED15|nr:pentatricopeptide repeat-containing protein At1g26460, mitochondrial-like [Vitis riparia]
MDLYFIHIRMLQTGKESMPDDESYELVVGMLFLTDQIDVALRYVDLTLKSGYMLSMRVFAECVRNCVNKGRLDALVSIIERCKTMDQNKALSPSWNMCIFIADIAMQEDNSKLAFYALEFMARWIARGENARGPVLLSVDEGLVVSALETAGRTYSSTLLDASWAILRRSLRQKKAPQPESYLAKYMSMQHWGICREHLALCMSLKPLIGTPPKKQKRIYSHLLHLYIHW